MCKKNGGIDLECFPFARAGRPEKSWFCIILKNNHSANGTRYFEEIRRTRIKLILQIGSFCLRTDRSGGPILTNGKRPSLCAMLLHVIWARVVLCAAPKGTA